MANFAGYITNNGQVYQGIMSGDGKAGPIGPQGAPGEPGPQGIPGQAGKDGNGIVNIELISTDGKLKTYRINFTDGTHFDYQVQDGNDGVGTEDMAKATYDANDNGIVDDAEKVNGHTVDSDVPANAKFTDTVYDDTEVKQEIADALTAAKTYTDEELAKFDFIKVVDELPETGLPNKVYFVPKTDTETQDLFDEYVWVDNKWEWITTKQIQVDLTPYATKTYVDNAVANAGGEISNSATTNVPIYHVWVGSQEQYEAITTLDANTIYNIIEE